MNLLVDWARAIADALEGSPLWLELTLVILGMLGFFVVVALGLVALAWVVSLPGRIHDVWARRR